MIVILGSWIIWKHRNACIFEGARPCISNALGAFEEEQHLWCMDGARGLHRLALGQGSELG